MGSYSRYAMNINKRHLFIEPETYKRVHDNIRESGQDYSDVYLEMLELQYKDYIDNKDRPKAAVQGRRSMSLAGLVGDRHGILVSSGCCLTEYKAIYTVDYVAQLELLFALAFNMTIGSAKKKIELVLKDKDTSKEYLALILLTNVFNIDKPTDITIGDLNKIDEVKDFLLSLIRDEVNNGVPVLGNLDGTNYLEYIELDDNPTSALSVSIMLKLLREADRLNKELVVKHYGRGGSGIVLSQDYSSISFASNDVIDSFTINHKGETIELPMKVHRRD